MTLAVFQTTVQNANGDAIPSAQVTVRLGSSSGALASLFSNSAGTTPITNPFNATTSGFARCFTAPGVYWISITGGGSTQVLERVVLAGDAATRDVTTSASDTTGGRLMKVGDGGLLSGGGPVITDFNQSLPVGFYSGAGAGAVNYPGSGNYQFASFCNLGRSGSNYRFGAWLGLTNAEIRVDRLEPDGTRANGVDIYHSLNLLHLQNTSGATVNSNTTVAGSELTPAQTGTWRNVAGVNISNNNFGLFMRV